MKRNTFTFLIVITLILSGCQNGGGDKKHKQKSHKHKVENQYAKKIIRMLKN